MTTPSDNRQAALVYRLFLYMYPAAFRAAYGPQMLQHFRDRMREERDHGALGLVRVWRETGADLWRSLRPPG